MVCGGTGCTSSGSDNVAAAFVSEIKKAGLDKEVAVIRTGCFGLCELGPVVVIYPEGVFYSKMKPEYVPEIVEEHLLKGRPVTKYLFGETVSEKEIKPLEETTFYKKQMRVALRNCGIIDPEDIEEAIAMGAYEALGKVLTTMTPEQVIDEMKKSGLRGRGGGGFPTGLKWEFAHKQKETPKYVVCNADEGDPGAFMDRSIMEGDPHSVLEGMAIAGYAIGANHGVIYVRAEYPLAVKRLQIAIKQAREYGLLGGNIFGTDFSFDVEIRFGAGAFVCGEETALLNSVMGRRGEPRPRPPYPAVKGLWNKPTIINNVETFANVPAIISNGAAWFSSIGTEKSKGTKVFALTGKVNRTGLIEVPMGTTLRDIIFDIGGGIPDGKRFKAVQIGGPSGGCIPEEHLDTVIDYDSLISLGAMMGSGGLVVMDEDTCMVNVAKFFLEFIVDESCGKCAPCRIGTKRMLEILDKITSGKGEPEDIDRLEKLATTIKDTALCGLGQTAPNAVLSTLRYFRNEYEAHINQKKCPAGVCQALLSYTIIADKCRGCGLCARNCPVNAISGQLKQPFVINQEACIKCGTCFEKCPFGAIVKQ
jgi:NADP-reducing hydrogenase subunit HndC